MLQKNDCPPQKQTAKIHHNSAYDTSHDLPLTSSSELKIAANMLGSKLLDAGNLPSGAFLANKDGLGRFRKDSALLNSDVSVGCINLAVRTARKLTGLSESEIMLYSRNEMRIWQI